MRVLFITGVYYPEINGANLQARLLAQRLALLTTLKCYVLTGHGTLALPAVSRIDRTIVVRNRTVGNSLLDRSANLLRFLQLGFILAKKVGIVHFHGFSLRNGLLQILLKTLRKKSVIKMTLLGIDDPLSIKQASRLRWILFKQFDRYVGLTPAFTRSYVESGLDLTKYLLVPNGIDLSRFKRKSLIEKELTRSQLSLPSNDFIVVYVGHFSRIKNPLFVYQVWAEIRRRGLSSTLVMIGANQNRSHVDNTILHTLLDNALYDGFSEGLILRDHTDDIDRYLQAADLYISASTNEGLSNALLEALAVGLPSLTTSLPGNTDWIREQLGLLITINSQNVKEWAEEILLDKNRLFFDTRTNHLEFLRFRKTFNCESMARKIYKLYRDLEAE